MLEWLEEQSDLGLWRLEFCSLGNGEDPNPTNTALANILGFVGLLNESNLIKKISKFYQHIILYINKKKERIMLEITFHLFANSQNTRKYWRTSPRRLITISTAEGRWQGNWTSDYIFTLRDLQLEDLAEDGQKDAHVFIKLCIQKVHYLPMLHLFNTW